LRFDAPIFVSIGERDLSLPRPYAAPFIFGLCFIEAPLPPQAVENAKHYAWIFTGSSWCTQRLRDAGIHHCSTLVQGVDHSLFKPQAWPEMKGFRVFSGGKLEYRKGQDIVLAAMRAFMAQRIDAYLITSWNNPWPKSAETMVKSYLIDPDNPLDGLPKERIISVPPVRNEEMPSLYRNTHVGVFPNRCEAGTNMVLTEYMACGRPVIATTATGHADILTGPGPWLLPSGDEDPAGWSNCNVSDVIAALEYAYSHREELEPRGLQCAQLVTPWTWERAAELLARQAQDCLRLRAP
jgi:glycosyltransferase involved in cell wall biosynthesis